MSYGCGNYMCRGDPGFFGNVFGAIKGVVGGAIGGFIKGGPIGAIAGAAGGAIRSTASNIGDATLHSGDLTPAQQSAFLGKQRATHAASLAAHSGAAAGQHMIHHGGGGGRRRRMNWANGRALSRAERRMRSFLKHAKRFIKLSHPKPVGVHLKFHKKRRAA